MATTTRNRSGASPMLGNNPSLTETHKHKCPQCSSGAVVMAPGHILADATGMIRIEYRCHECGTPFWLLQHLALGERRDDELILRDMALAAIRRGRLPALRQPAHAGAGPGVDAPCAVCERPVHRQDLELVIQFEQRGAAAAFDTLHLHLRCFAVWELERHAEQGDPIGPAFGPMGTTAVSGASSPPLEETRAWRCPHCLSGAIVARGRVTADSKGVRSEYRCRDCGKDFLLLSDTRRLGASAGRST